MKGNHPSLFVLSVDRRGWQQHCLASKKPQFNPFTRYLNIIMPF
ncbi:hypothetical protein C942_03822 [Photobacterium marinum]|uniref:Uncharacterized protein n=1 Tax=Photobacterium marinum TaxID=1056511 RepID=L8J3E5_9GAMM|nr:hypothetical protein C942_03822 [Photobacterium marinum]